MGDNCVLFWRWGPAPFFEIKPFKAYLPNLVHIIRNIRKAVVAKSNTSCGIIRQKKINPPCHFQRKERFAFSKLEYGFFAKSAVTWAFQRLRANLEMRLPNFFSGPAFAKAETRLPSPAVFLNFRFGCFPLTEAVTFGPRIDGVRKNGINMRLFWFRNA